jgi:hypothetical protein
LQAQVFPFNPRRCRGILRLQGVDAVQGQLNRPGLRQTADSLKTALGPLGSVRGSDGLQAQHQ